jgi:hypothetical protein
MHTSSLAGLTREQYHQVISVRRILRKSVGGGKVPYNEEFDKLIMPGCEGKFSLSTADKTRTDYLIFCAAEEYDPVIVSLNEERSNSLREKHAADFSPEARFYSQFSPEILTSTGLIFCDDWWVYREENKIRIYATKRVKLAVGRDGNMSGGTTAFPL